jgi:chemotaxis protein histidine kinase CheA
MNHSTALEGRLLDLKQRYVRSLPERIGAIASTLTTLGDGSRGMTEKLGRQFHTLAGTAGMYDLNSVSAAAAEGEEACSEINRNPVDGSSFQYLSFLVDQLYGALEADGGPRWARGAVLSATDAWVAVSPQTGVIVA